MCGMKAIFGKKVEMSQIFNGEGNVVPVTVVAVEQNVVLRVKSKEKDGYDALVVGFGKKNEKNIRRAERGLFRNLGNFRYIKEMRAENEASHERGSAINAAIFQEGDTVHVSGISKAKGFQGVVKRHGFHGAPKSHGTKHAHREPGSIGGRGGRAGGRVAKGMKMAGRMGGERVTVRNLKIVKVDAENNLLAVGGAVPGRRGTLLEIRG